MKREKATRIGVALVVGGALLVRLVGVASESLWLDEIATVRFVAEHGLWDVIRETFRIDYHPFAYYAFLDLWTMAFGTSDRACRLLSAVLGAASVAAAYRLSVTVGLARVAAFGAAMIVTIGPTDVWYSQECRMYILLVVTWALCLDGLIRMVRAGFPGRRIAVFLVTFFVFAYAHGSCGLVVLPFLLGVIFLCRTPTGPDAETGCIVPARSGEPIDSTLPSHPLWRRVVASGLAILIYAPWIVRLLVVAPGEKSLETLGPAGTRELVEWLILFNQRPPGPLYALFWAGIGVCGFGALTRFRERASRSPFSPCTAHGILLGSLALPTITTAILTLAVPFHQTRNLVFLFVPMVVALVGGLAGLTDALARRTKRWGASLVRALAVILAIGAVGYLARATTWNLLHHPQKEDWRGATRYILERTRTGDRVAFYAGFTMPCFEFYAEREHAARDPDVTAGAPSGGLQLVRIDREPAEFAESTDKLLQQIELRPGDVWVVYSHVPEPLRLEESLIRAGLTVQSTADFRDVLVRSYRVKDGP
jgi:uncharacterized membrane protein